MGSPRSVAKVIRSFAPALSKLAGPPMRSAKNESTKVSCIDMLESHGFVRQAGSGIYDMMPLGLRVQKKLANIIRKHLDKVGCSELELSTLVNPQLWHASGRLDPNHANSEFTFTESKKFLLAPTGEEQITTLVGSVSYKQLPLSLYQITRKFRNELRPRGGLLRTREFLMKDLYTFDADKPQAIESYQLIQQAYREIFEEIGVPFLVAEADSGDMGGNLSHEYHYVDESGEDMVVECKSCQYAANVEKAQAQGPQGEIKTSNLHDGDKCVNCGEELTLRRCIEVGHTFYLGDRYTKPLKALVTPAQGRPTPIEMGCYGIGVTRIIGAVADKFMDEHGLVWPRSIAPFQVCVVSKDIDLARSTAVKLVENGIEATYEDRTSQIGQSMRTAREMGFPYTVVLGKSWEKEGLAEILPRRGSPTKVAADQLAAELQRLTI